MKRFLLDTNVVSELRKLRPHGAVVAWLRSLQPIQVSISAVTIGELQYGSELTRRQDAKRASELDAWIQSIVDGAQLLSMDDICFREWARLMQHKSHDMLVDGMLAATARIHGLTIATRDEADFKQFGVEIVNPFKTR
jgi:predicted nucleic acid-binding protein